MKIKKYRELNRGECFACPTGPLKAAFSDTDVRICLGLSRDFSFDYNAQPRPRIRGRIVADLTINRRERSEDPAPMLCMYVAGPDYSAQKQFESQCLPRLCEWLAQTAPESFFGMRSLLVEWTGNEFIFHEMRYM